MPKSSTHNSHYGENPYVAGNPIVGESGFFGRRENLEWVQEELRATKTSVFVVRGQRRIGKSTLLFQIKRSLPKDQFLTVYFDLQGMTQQPKKYILVSLADELLRVANLSKNKKIPVVPETEGNADTFQRDFLPRFIEKISPRKLIVLLDEFDVMQDEGDAKSLMEFFSKLTTEYPANLIFIIATGRDPSDLSKQYSQIFKGAVATKELWVLDRDSAIELVKQAEKNETLRFENEAIDRILNLTHCHPFLTQLICQRLWQIAYSGDFLENSDVPLITVDAVEAAVEDTLETGDLQLSWLWGGLSPEEKIYVSALAAISEENKSISEDQVVEVLSRHAARFRTSEVEISAPRYLLMRNFLEKDEREDRQYKFTVEIIRRWVRRNRPLQVVKQELDDVGMAEKVYAVGKAHFDRQEYELAKKQFENALVEKADHLKSLIKLGETYGKLGSLEDAVRILDKAYNLDPEEVRVTYARALVSLAQDQYKRGEEELALSASEQALRLSPLEGGAQKIKETIWNRRGDYALQKGDFQLALEAYIKSGNIEGQGVVNAKIEEESEALRKTLQIHPELVLRILLEAPLVSLAFSYDNVFLASGGENGNIIIWGPSTGNKMRVLKGHVGRVSSVEYSSDGKLLASGSEDKTISIWDAEIGRLKRVLNGHKSDVTCLSFSPKNYILASGGVDEQIILWNTITGEPVQYLNEHIGAITCLKFSPIVQAKVLASGSTDKTVIVWGGDNMKRIFSVDSHKEVIADLAFSPDGLSLAIVSKDGEISVWDISSGKSLHLLQGGGDARCVSYSPDGSIIVVSTKDKIEFWHSETGTKLTFIDLNSDILSMAYSNTGSNVIAFCVEDKTLQIWRIKP